MPWGEETVRVLVAVLAGHFFLREAVVFLAEVAPYFAGAWFLFLLHDIHDRRRALFILFVALIAIICARGIITSSIHAFFDHPRPFVALEFAPFVRASGPSFPSGHAALFFALATSAFLIGRRTGAWFTLFALLNGVARVAVGVHYPLDIAGGATIGILSGLLVLWIFRRETRALASLGTE